MGTKGGGGCWGNGARHCISILTTKLFIQFLGEQSPSVRHSPIKAARPVGILEAKLSAWAESRELRYHSFRPQPPPLVPLLFTFAARTPRACQSAMTAERMIRLPSRPSWEHHDSFLIYDYEPKMDVTGGPNRASTLSISPLPFVLFSGRTKARQSTAPLLPSDVSIDFPFSPITPPPPLPRLRQTIQQTLARPLHTPLLSTTTTPSSEPRVPAPPSQSVVLSGPGLPKSPQPLPMTVPVMSYQAAPVTRPTPQVETVPSSSYPRVRPLPQRPATTKPIEENLWAEPDDRPRRSHSAQVVGYHSELDSNALRRNRHIRRAQKVPLNGPRPLPPLPGTSPSISTVLMEPYDQTSKRVSSPTQPTTPRTWAALHRSKSDPTSPPLPRRPNLHLVIPKSQAANSGRHLPKQEPSPTTPSCDVESSGSRATKPQWHSLDYFPAIDYASMATPSASRRPPPSAHTDGGKDNTTLLDWHLLEEALGIDGDMGVTLSASPVIVSFLPSPGAPPVPAIPDRFLVDRELFRAVSQVLLSKFTYSISTTVGR